MRKKTPPPKIVYEVAENSMSQESQRRVDAAFDVLFEAVLERRNQTEKPRDDL